MVDEIGALTVYRILSEFNGKTLMRFVDVVENPGDLSQYDLKGKYDFKARLFVAKPEKDKPAWSDFLEHGFGTVSEVSETVSNNAVLVIKVLYLGKYLFFALPFGLGRYLLKSDSFERKYGMRVVLNTVFPKSGLRTVNDAARVRSVDARTVTANTVHTRRQTDFGATFESFEVDIQRDLLRAITGKPFKTDKWGSRISGANALYLRRKIRFKDLGDLCKQVERAARRSDYKERFSWIDNIAPVTDAKKIEQLEKWLLERLITEDIDSLELAPPEIVDWDKVVGFKFSQASKDIYQELRLEDYLKILEDKGKLTALDTRRLRGDHRVTAVDAEDKTVGRWSVGRCLTGELMYGGKTYLVHGSDFFEVAADFLGHLDDDVRSYEESLKNLPDAGRGQDEGEYNELVANASRDHLLLDRKLVKISTSTTAIELCDILTRDRCFIHVKKRNGASDMSHLFSQGSVSGDLFLMSKEFREAAQAVIMEAVGERRRSTRGGSFRDDFSTFDLDGISPADYEIVYAIIDDWRGRTLVAVLPFFSKVNLRRNVDDLRRMGYKVSYKRIQYV